MRSTVVLIVLLVLVAFAVPHAGRAAAGDGNDLLAKHRAFVGWTFGDGTFTSWREVTRWKPSASPAPSGTPDPDATPTPPYIINSVRRGALYHDAQARENSPVRSDDGFTGRVFWRANENGFVVTLLEDAARLAISSNAFDDEEVSKLPGTLHGNAKVGTVDVQIVRVQPGPGFPIDLYVDANGAYRRVVVSPDDAENRETVDIDNYIDGLPGKKIVGEYHSSSAGSYVVDKFEPNVPVEDAELIPPRPRATWSFGPPEPFPIDFHHYTAVYGNSGASAVMVHASINGHDGNFILDSGSAGILLFGDYARNLGLKRLGGGASSGVNGNIVRTSTVMIDSLSIGPSVLHNVLAAQSGGTAFPGEDGLIGFDVLANAIVDVDLDTNRMTIFDPAKFAPTVSKGATAFPVDLSEFVPQLHITVGNGIDSFTIVDTGNSSEVVLSDVLRTSGKIVGLTGQISLGGGSVMDDSIYLGGVDGTSAYPVPCMRLNHMSVGPYPFENGRVCFGPERAFGKKGGLIGIDFLRHFNWTFDYPDGKLILTPNHLK
jgi:hypothetical protein